jgi:hypothetical protein
MKMKTWIWILLIGFGLIGLLAFSLCRAAGLASRMEERMRHDDFPRGDM